MLMTEKEAGKRICPIADNIRIHGQTCIGSDCMAWRWWWNSDSKKSEERKGFCGMAGEPLRTRVVSMKHLVSEEE